jgi:hypothetical protein
MANENKNYYVCTKYGCTWYGKVSEMLQDYEYPENSTSYFDTEEEAIQEVDNILNLQTESF